METTETSYMYRKLKRCHCTCTVGFLVKGIIPEILSRYRYQGNQHLVLYRSPQVPNDYGEVNMPA